MIKYFYLLILILPTFAAHAQIEKGTLLLGGNLMFDNAKSNFSNLNDEKKTITAITPSLGVAIKRNLELGVRFSYQYSKDEYATYQGTPPTTMETLYKMNGYGLAIYLRRYKELWKKLSIYVEGDLTGNSSRTQQNYNGEPKYTDQKVWSVTASGTAGVVYRISGRWMLETGFTSLVSAGYSHVKDDGQGAITNGVVNKANYVSVGSSFSQPLTNFSFGCRYILN